MAVPRGIRNNNPGNLIITPLKWQGKVPFEKNTDGHFEQFTSMAYGVRAMLKDMINDINKDGLNTITKLITKYAPPHENNTANYIKLVSQKTGIGANAILKPDKDTLLKLGSAVTGVENGWTYQLPISEIEKGYNLIGGGVIDTVKRHKGKALIGVGILAAVGGYMYYENKN